VELRDRKQFVVWRYTWKAKEATLQRRDCVSAKFTDPTQKPSWKGRRFRFRIKPPDRIDLWKEYVELRQADFQAGDSQARRSHQWYLDRREIMDAGAVVANPNRFNGDTLPDGSQACCARRERGPLSRREGAGSAVVQWDARCN